MKIISDIWSSINGHANARAKDPVVGTFVVAWGVCNWDKWTLLFWGSGEVDERINNLVQKMAIIDYPKLIVSDLDLLALPAALTLFYLFALPWLSLWVNRKQKRTIISQHSHAVDLDIEQAKKQRELNKQRLRLDPEKGFLEKDVELDIQKEKERVERRNRVRDYIDKKAKAAQDLARKAQADAEASEHENQIKRIEAEEKERKNMKEKQRFELQSQIHRATLASHEFPAAYFFLERLDQSLRMDDINLSLAGLSACLAAVFGYDDFQQLVDDTNFSNENVEKLKYVLADNSLPKKLAAICDRESGSENEVDSEVVYDHIYAMFEGLPFQILSESGLVEEITNTVEESSYEFLDSDELAGPMAETDTIFEDIELEKQRHEFKQDFSVEFHGYASGCHRRESDVKGRELDVRVRATCKPVIGKFGFGEIEYEIGGSPKDYGVIPPF